MDEIKYETSSVRDEMVLDVFKSVKSNHFMHAVTTEC